MNTMNKKLMAFALAAVLILGAAMVYLTQSVNEVMVPLQIQKDDAGIPATIEVNPTLLRLLESREWVPLLVKGQRGEGLKTEVLKGPEGWSDILFSKPDYQGFLPLQDQTYLLLVESTPDIKDRWEGRFEVFALHAVEEEQWDTVLRLTEQLGKASPSTPSNCETRTEPE